MAELQGCGCKGIRSCLLCEPRKAASRGQPITAAQSKFSFIYCTATGFALGEEASEFSGCGFLFPGVFLINDFVSEDEEHTITSLMDQDAWKISQSGRKKQDYGPNVNFKKQKLKAGCFSGLPSFSQEIVKRMKDYAILQGFQPVEQCNLDYNSQRGSAIDPHFDDWWLWGERLVTLNLLSDTVLTLSSDSGDNIQLFATTSQKETKHISANGISKNYKKPNIRQMVACSENDPTNICNTTRGPLTECVPSREVQVLVHLPQRSLVILSGDARFKWKHAIYREHIDRRRVCCTFRELSAEFSTGGKQEKLGLELLNIALSFQGKPT